MTVWGIAQVIESNVERIVVGERLYGFFPMSSHVVMEPGHVSEGSFIDIMPHRQALPNLYNQYARTRSESADLQDIEDERCIFFPLFVTGYVELVEHRIRDFDDDSHIGMIVCFQ